MPSVRRPCCLGGLETNIVAESDADGDAKGIIAIKVMWREETRMNASGSDNVCIVHCNEG